MFKTDFILPAKRKHVSDPDLMPIEESLWVDKYEPNDETDICMRADKIKEIKSAILHSSVGDQQQETKLLILSGPSGCGKSTLIRLLSKSMPFELIEWKYPSTDYDLDNYVNIMNQFQHFLNLSIRRDTMQQYQKKSKMKVIFVDDIPDITTPQVKRDFHSILSNCLNTPIRFLLVLVISGAWMESSHKRTYDTKLNNLIDITPQEFEYDKRVKHIKLKPVNKTCMTKALNRVIHGQDIYMSKDQLNDLIETSDGDLRSAINNLQFYAKRNQHYTKRRKTFDEKIGPLDLFHAVGKVLYAKRHADHTLQSKPEHILNKLPMDPDLFSTYLHQNCLVFFEDIDSVAKSFDYLSLADTIRSSLDWQDDQASLYRSLVTMHGLMERPTRTTSNRFYAMQKPDMFDAQLAMRQKKSQDYYREWMASVECRSKPFEQQDQQVALDDPVQDFSEDEFDDMYGDGSDLALLDMY